MKAVRKTLTLPYSLPVTRLAAWCARFSYYMLLDSNTEKTGQNDPYSSYDFLVAADSINLLLPDHNHFEALRDFHNTHHDWMFGHLSYELKEELTGLTSKQEDRIQFPKLSFFIPRYVITGKNGTTTIHYREELDDEHSIQEIIDTVSSSIPPGFDASTSAPLTPGVNREEYIQRAGKFLQHIRRGDIYEANYCIEQFSSSATISPLTTFLRLNDISPMPGAAFYRHANKYLLCASPERFIAKRGQKLISQPIKGTIRRGTTADEDVALKSYLENDPKERSENVMITDLVRNDLSMVATRGSVKVEELMSVKTFPRIHQLVTTITATLSNERHWTEALSKAFPMGSMTGAPKRRAMEIIDELENCRRGLYSGSVGYVQPDGDFDFNVVIRSIQYDSQTKQLSVMAGSALTAGCKPELEYEECLLKFSTMQRALA